MPAGHYVERPQGIGWASFCVVRARETVKRLGI